MRGDRMSTRNTQFAQSIDFTNLPPAASNVGRVFQCNPLVAGQGYFYMVSDGTFYRPYGGEQKGYVLGAPIDMAVNSDYQFLLRIPIPPRLIVCGRSYIKTVICADKLAVTPPATSDTSTFYQYFGPNGDNTDPILFSTVFGTTIIDGGITNEASRLSATSMRKHGAGGVGAANSMSGTSSTVRPPAITVGNLATTTNYLSVYGKMTTGTNEYGQLHAYTMEFMG